jgi:hypothetical protein
MPEDEPSRREPQGLPSLGQSVQQPLLKNAERETSKRGEHQIDRRYRDIPDGRLAYRTNFELRRVDEAPQECLRARCAVGTRDPVAAEP